MKPTVGSLFSGIGGFDLGLERAGWTVRWQVENNPYRRQTLKRHWPQVELRNDIRTDTNGLERVDLICGGFPCQDLSVAGSRKGLAGSRSSLFFQFARVLRALRPRWCLIENVPGLLSICSCRGCHRAAVLLRWHRRKGRRNPEGGNCYCGGCQTARAVRTAHRGSDFRLILATMDDIGFGLSWRILDSQHFGVPQRRRRVYIVGHLGAPCPPDVLFEPESLRGNTASGRTAGQDVAGTLGGGAGGRGWTDDLDRSGAFIPEVSGTLGGGSRDHRPLLDGSGAYIPERARPLVGGGNDRRDESQETHLVNARQDPIVGKPALDTDGYSHAVAIRTAQTGSNGWGIGTDGKAYTLDETQGQAVVQRVAGTVTGAEAHNGNSRPIPANYIAQPLRANRWGGSDSHGDEGNVVVGPAPDADRVRKTPGIPGRMDGGPDGPRYAALGDAVTVPVAEWIGRRILKAHMKEEKSCRE